MPRVPDLPKHTGLGDTLREMRRPMAQEDTGWIEVQDTTTQAATNFPGDPGSEAGGFWPLFKNSWGNVDPTGVAYPRAAFYMSKNGEVRFRGHVTGGATGSVMFVLPEGYRPEAVQDFIVPTDSGGHATLRVKPNGEVSLVRIRN